MANITTIIFDLNGVFIVSPKLSDRFEKDFDVNPEVFLPTLQKVMAEVRLPGARGVYECFAPYLSQWGVGLTETEFLDYWFRAEKENEEMTDFARSLKKEGLQLFVLSNNFHERAAYYQKHFPFLEELFIKVYYSWQTGLVKPSREALELLLQENNLRPDECMYFDDSEENVRVAAMLGIQAKQFLGNEEVKKELHNDLI